MKKSKEITGYVYNIFPVEIDVYDEEKDPIAKDDSMIWLLLGWLFYIMMYIQCLIEYVTGIEAIFPIYFPEKELERLTEKEIEMLYSSIGE